jgi:hypothetical protein
LVWELNPDDMYSIKEVYELIFNFEDIADFPLYKVVWNNLVSLRLHCLLGDYFIIVWLKQLTNHLFFDCSGSGKLWVDDLSWLGISCAMINNSFCRAVQFIGLVSQWKKVNEWFYVIWLFCI